MGDDNSTLLDLLPEEYSYVILDKFHIRCNISSQGTALKWLEEYEAVSGTQWRVKKTFPNLSTQVIFKKQFRCHMNTRASDPSSKTTKPHEKHTNCSAKLTITVKNPEMLWSKDQHLQQHPCVILFTETHNHAIKSADSLRHRRPNPEIREKFLKLFESHHSPSSALEIHKIDLQQEHGDDYFLYAGDGAVCPSQKWCYRLYTEIFEKEYGKHNGPNMIESLNSFVKKYNKQFNSICAKVDFDPANPRDLVVVICSPIMKSVHRYLRASGEIVFVDSSGNVDRHNTRIFKFTSPSVAGALPLAILMTYSESESVLKRGFLLLQTIIPDNSFFGEGVLGPKIFMTDNSDSLRNALSVVFTKSTLLLCKFHILQAYWRYLWDSHNQVIKADRPVLFKEFQKVLNLKTEKEFEEGYNICLENASKYTNVVSYLTKLRLKATEWAMCHRQHLITRGHDTNNYSEADFRTLKDKVFHRLKSGNVVQTFDFVTSRGESYLERRIVDVLSNRAQNYTKSRYFIPKSKIEDLQCIQLSDSHFIVKNMTKGTEYDVDISIDICSCPIGYLGAPCKHQYAVHIQFETSSRQFLPIFDPETKKTLHMIIYGSNENIPEGWYDNLSGPRSFAADSSFNVPTEDPVPDAHSLVDNNTPNGDHGMPSENPLSVQVQGTKDLDIESCLEDIIKMTEDLKSKVKERPDQYVAAVKSMTKSYNNCKSESSLLSALHSFGKTTTIQARSYRSTIPVQKTAEERRKTYLGGSKLQHTGRPPKDYVPSSKRPADPTWAQPPMKRAAPHSLSQCVTNCTSLGKTHSKK